MIFATRSPINSKHVFFGLSIFFLLFYSYLSFDYGIWWDEWTNTNYAELILKYFLSLGRDKTATNYHYNMPYYGGLFDVIAVGFYHIFKLFGIYETRHLFNILSGIAGIVYAGLFAKEILNWKVGIITLLFLFFSPHYIGNAMNNPKDIPFASAYMMSLYYLLFFIRQLPRPKWSICVLLALSISIALGIRAGGLILFCYLILFVILFMIRFKDKADFFSITLKTFTVIFIGYFGGLVAWPIAQLHPFTIPFKALTYFSNFPNVVAVLFEGKYIGSNILPWYYIPKLIFLTSPAFLVAGIVSLIFLLWRKKRDYSKFPLFLILFAVVFPFIYSLIIHSSFYDGWRHFYFIYPGICILSAVGIDCVFSAIKHFIFRVIAFLLFLILLFEPVIWSMRNHPHEGVYFTPLVGGINNVYSDYQTDCLGNSMRYGAEWLGKFLNKNNVYSATIYTNANPESSHYYLKNFGNFTIIRDREGSWDYELLLSRYLTKNQLLNEWPPAGAIFKVKADSATLCAVVKIEK